MYTPNKIEKDRNVNDILHTTKEFFIFHNSFFIHDYIHEMLNVNAGIMLGHTKENDQECTMSSSIAECFTCGKLTKTFQKRSLGLQRCQTCI